MSDSEKFIEWMKQKVALDQYCENIGTNLRVERFLKTCSSDCFIQCAFIWSKNSEDHKYWSKLNKEWLAFIKE